MSPQARAYYLPAYLLTALPLLTAMPFESLPYVQGKASPAEFTGCTLDALRPPLGLDVWVALTHLPAEASDPLQQDLDAIKAEDFLRFARHLTTLQKHAIRRFATLALMTYYKPLQCTYDEIASLTECWIWPDFA